jgi:hypothetical protein
MLGLNVAQPEPGLACDVGISGLGSNPTNPWCQRPRRSPPNLPGNLCNKRVTGIDFKE